MTVAEALAYYELGTLVEIVPFSGGTANRNYRVTTNLSEFFVKCRVPRLSQPEAVAFEHMVLQHLGARGLPVAPPVPLRGSTQTILRDGDHIWEVSPFIEGRRFSGSPQEIMSAAAVLGKIHRSLICCEIPLPLKNCPVHENREQIVSSLETAIPLFRQHGLEVEYETFARTLARLESEYYGSLANDLMRGIVHGDYHALNMVFTPDGSVAGIFDFNATGVQIQLRDVVDGLITFGREDPAEFGGDDIFALTRPFHFDIAMMRIFLRAYNHEKKLAPVECEAIPLMLRQRWLGIKLDPIRHGKVQAASADRLLRDAHAPLAWLDENERCLRKMIFEVAA